MYEQYFGLNSKPFQLTPDPDFFFSSRGHSRASAVLEYGLLQKEGFIVITGDVGAGKTTLIRGLLRRLVQQQVVAAQIVSTQVEADDLLRLVAQAFQVYVPGLDKAETLARLEARFQALHMEQRRALLIIDEAQNLSPRAVEELRMLSNYQAGNDALVQSFLVGQPEFRNILQRSEMRQLKQRVIAMYHLGPLDQEETRQYVEHRLAHAGWKGNPFIEPAVYPAVHAFAEGIPRRINTLLDRLLLDCYLDSRQTIGIVQVDLTLSDLAEESQVPQTVASPLPRERAAFSPMPPAHALETQSNVIALRDQDLERLPTRYDLLEARIQKLESVQVMLQRMVTRAPASERGSAGLQTTSKAE